MNDSVSSTLFGPPLALADIRVGGSGLPSRGVVHGTEGTGKTSFGCAAPKPVFLMTKGETGLETLIDNGQVAETPHFPEVKTWEELLGAVKLLTVEPHDYRTLVVDTLNGAERLCHEHVCARDFDGRWGKDGFTAYMVGYETSVAEWRRFLAALDRLRAERRMMILTLCHTKVAPYKNPEGPDYDRFTPELHPKTWGLTHKWADYVLFLHFASHVEAARNQTKGKGRGGRRRVLYTMRTAAYDAKNRHGLPDEIDSGDSAADLWNNFAAAMKAARTQQSEPADVPPAASESDSVSA